MGEPVRPIMEKIKHDLEIKRRHNKMHYRGIFGSFRYKKSLYDLVCEKVDECREPDVYMFRPRCDCAWRWIDGFLFLYKEFNEENK